MNKTFQKLGFKEGDVVVCTSSTKPDFYKVGDEFTLKNFNGVLTAEGYGKFNGYFGDWKLKEKDMFEDQWHLNDGKVEIPDDADKLEKNGSVVAFRKRISPKYKFGDILIGKCTKTEYRFIKYDTSKDRYATLLSSLNKITQAQNLDNYKLKTND